MNLTRLGFAASVAVCVFVVLSLCAAADNSSCFYGGKLYKDGEKNIHSGACQLCTLGKWIDRDASACPDCSSKSDPQDTTMPGGDKDCIYNHQAFSDGAIHSHDGKCWVCVVGQWAERDPSRCKECK
jgi:hypothetical protein